MDPKIIGFVWSIAIHATIFAIMLASGCISGCRLKKQPLEFTEFTIAVDPAEDIEEPTPVTPSVKSPPPPKPDDIAQPKPKKDPPKKDPPKKVEKKDPPKNTVKKEIKKGKHVTRKVESHVKPKERQTLSDAEIEKWLGKRAKIGETTSLPQNEVSLNVSILRTVFYEAWTPPQKSASGSRPAIVSFKITRDGTLHSPSIIESSGSPAYDNSCLEAIRRVGRVSDLTPSFIREYGNGCSFTFELQN